MNYKDFSHWENWSYLYTANILYRLRHVKVCWRVCHVSMLNDYYKPNIFGSSSAIFGNLLKSSETFIWHSDNIRKIFGEWLEIFGKLSKTSLLICCAPLLFIRNTWLPDCPRPREKMERRAITSSVLEITRRILFWFVKYRIIHGARRYEISLGVFNSISHESNLRVLRIR